MFQYLATGNRKIWFCVEFVCVWYLLYSFFCFKNSRTFKDSEENGIIKCLFNVPKRNVIFFWYYKLYTFSEYVSDGVSLAQTELYKDHKECVSSFWTMELSHDMKMKFFMFYKLYRVLRSLVPLAFQMSVQNEQAKIWFRVENLKMFIIIQKRWEKRHKLEKSSWFALPKKKHHCGFYEKYFAAFGGWKPPMKNVIIPYLFICIV